MGNQNQIQDMIFDLVAWCKWAVKLEKARQELIMHGWKAAGGENSQAKPID